MSIRRIIAPIVIVAIVGATYLYLPQKVFAVPSKELSILFIGNSYTYVNNLPDMLEKIADSDTDNDTKYHIKSVTSGGATLTNLWDSGNARSELKKQHWDFVVLQQQSMWALFDDTIAENNIATKKWSTEIIASSAKPILYETWARQPGSSWYTDPKKHETFISYVSMNYRIHTYIYAIANKLGITVMPIGDCWNDAMTANPSLPLYGGDGSHPSPAGTYFTALIFYRYFSQRPLNHIEYTPDGVSSDLATTLKMLVSEQSGESVKTSP